MNKPQSIIVIFLGIYLLAVTLFPPRIFVDDLRDGAKNEFPDRAFILSNDFNKMYLNEDDGSGIRHFRTLTIDSNYLIAQIGLGIGISLVLFGSCSIIGKKKK